MIELIDKGSNKKVMALIICGVKYRDDSYLIYSVRREAKDANIFISRLVINSEGATISDNFSNGEKKVMEDVVKKIINKTSIEELGKMGFEIISDINLTDVNYFSVKNCYVSTVPRNLIKVVMEFYGLLKEKELNAPIVEVEDDKMLNAGFASNLILIIFGVFLVLFCIGVIYGVVRR